MVQLWSLGGIRFLSYASYLCLRAIFEQESLLLVLFVLLLCLILQIVFFIYALVQLNRKRLCPGLACLFLSIIFLILFWGLKTDVNLFFGIFAVVCMIALPVWFFFVYKKA